MKAAFIVSWSTSVPGREKKSIEYFRDFNEFYGKLAAEGKCTEPEFFVGPGGRRFWFVKGEYETLVGFLTLPKVQEFMFTGDYLAQDFEYGIGPAGADEFIQSFKDVGVKLGFI
jgi:hypothetical protein